MKKTTFIGMLFLLFVSACQKEKVIIPTFHAEEISTLVNSSLNKILFIDDQIAFAIGDHGVFLESNDGGANWNFSATFLNTDFNLFNIQFPVPDTGFVHARNSIGNAYKIFKTTNGGQDWEEFNTAMHIIDFPTSTHGYGFTDVYAYKTTDGGNSWTAMVNFPHSAFNPRVAGFASKDKGIVRDFNNIFFSTLDGGESWYSVNLYSLSNANRIKFYSDSDGFIIGRGRIMKTSNSGSNWMEVYGFDDETAFRYLGVDIKLSTAIIVGEHSVLISRDQGATWKYLYNQQGINIPEIFTDVVLINENTALATTRSGSIYKIQLERS